MSRIRKVCASRLRALLLELNPRRPEQGVRWWLDRAQQSSHEDGISLTHALEQSVCRLRRRVSAFSGRRLTPDRRSQGPITRMQNAGAVRTDRGDSFPPFLCDAGLGGLARWLRAAGYDAAWQPDIDDAELLRQATRLGATILTTDSLMMERGILRDGIIPAFWLPPTLTMAEQLELVFREFQLAVREPRCMSCGGELQRGEKACVRDRIPPKTWVWLDEYFLCARCHQVFWRGTHWRKIGAQLAALSSIPRDSREGPFSFSHPASD